MMQIITTFISSNNSIPVASIIIIGMLILTYIQSHYILNRKVDEIKESVNGSIEKAIDDVVLDIEEVSYVRAAEIMTSRWEEVAKCKHGEDAKTCDFIEKYYNYESDKFRGILHESLQRTKESIRTHIKINGFHEMSPLDLETYVARVGCELFDYNKRVMRIKGVDTLDLVKNTHELRFTKAEATEAYKRIVNEVIRIKKEGKEKIKKAKKTLRVNNKILNLVKGYFDGESD